MFKSKVFQDYNRGLKVPDSLSLSIMELAASMFIKWSVSTKVKETHFKIMNNIYPAAEFLKKIKFEVDLCAFCGDSEETLEHLFFLCPVVQCFWSNIYNWLSLKIYNIPSLNISHIFFTWRT